MRAVSQIRLRAFAKINLGLKILGKRADGYHEIRTLFQTISLHDRLEISLHPRRHGIEVACDEPSIPSGCEDLVSRACELWRGARKFKGGSQVHLEKKIPAGSDLGGASSDAAATILGLERLTGDRLTTAARFAPANGIQRSQGAPLSICLFQVTKPTLRGKLPRQRGGGLCQTA